MPARILSRDQRRQLERLHEADVADLPRRRLGNKQVLVLERSLEEAARVALSRSLLPGAETAWPVLSSGANRRSLDRVAAGRIVLDFQAAAALVYPR
jgi:hypothetical protein